MQICIRNNDCKLLVESPYNTDFVKFARMLGAKWSRPCWVFDPRDEARVREKCLEVYGTDGISEDLVTLKITWLEDASAYRESIAVVGRPVATAFGRDSGAKIGDGVAVLDGDFFSSGSMKNWTTATNAGTVCQSALKNDPPSASKIDPPQRLVFV